VFSDCKDNRSIHIEIGAILVDDSALEVCYENALYKFTFDIDIDIEVHFTG